MWTSVFYFSETPGAFALNIYITIKTITIYKRIHYNNIKIKTTINYT